MFSSFLKAAASVAFMATPALAMPATMHVDRSASHTSIKMPSKKATHHPRTATSAVKTKVVARGRQEVRALNALESAGYRQLDELHAQGADSVATVTKAGKSYDVTVTPTGQITAKRA